MINYNYCLIFVYSSLLLLRLLLLWSPGYVHTDEHFQNGQITGQDVLLLRPVFTAWEFDVSNPVRSIVGPYLSTGIFFFIAEWVKRTWLAVASPSPWSSSNLLFISRLGMFFWSLPIDYLIYKTASQQRKNLQVTGLLLYSSSWIALVMMIRPFMNSLITVIYAACIVIILQAIASKTLPSLSFGALISLGVFIHTSFICFAVPLVLAYLYLLIQQCKNDRIARVVTCALKGGLGFLLVTLVCITCDSLYYSQKGNSSNLHIVVAPWANFIYNTNVENLRQHTLHPFYLHALVNMFILFGPLYVLFALRCIKMGKDFLYKLKRKSSLTPFARDFFLIGCILLPLILLSIIPHQEPRFLLPLTFPMIVLLLRSIQMQSRQFAIIWIAFNAIFVLFFGFLHQGGIIPSLAFIGSSSASASANVAILYHKTYMPPTYLLANYKSTVVLFDYSGTNQRAFFKDHIKKLHRERTPHCYFVYPAYLDSQIIDVKELRLKRISRIWPHLALDDIDLLIQDIYNGFTLDVYTLDN